MSGSRATWIQGLVMQLHRAHGIGDQVLNMPGEFADRLQGQAVGLFSQFGQAGFHAVDGVAVIADQMQVVQAFLGLGQQHFGFPAKLGKCGLPFVYAYSCKSHNLWSGDEMSHRVNGLKLALKYDWGVYNGFR